MYHEIFPKRYFWPIKTDISWYNKLKNASILNCLEAQKYFDLKVFFLTVPCSLWCLVSDDCYFYGYKDTDVLSGCLWLTSNVVCSPLCFSGSITGILFSLVFLLTLEHSIHCLQILFSSQPNTYLQLLETTEKFHELKKRFYVHSAI